jgi:hypothetical protein
MGLFNFMKKRRAEELPLPPPPPPEALPPMLKGDIEPITAPEAPSPMPPMEEHFEELPELPPALPAPTQEFPPAGEKEVSLSPAFRERGSAEVKVFDRTIMPEAVEEEQPIRETIRATPKPTFVAVEDYKRIINDTNTIRSKLMDAENFVRRLSDLKNEEERAFEKWRTQLEDVEKKLNYVDHLIAKAQS